MPHRACLPQLAALPCSSGGPHHCVLTRGPRLAPAPPFGMGLLLPGISVQQTDTLVPRPIQQRRQARTQLTGRPTTPRDGQLVLTALFNSHLRAHQSSASQNQPESLLSHGLLGSTSISEPGRRLRICLSNKFPGAADAAGPGTTSGDPLCP